MVHVSRIIGYNLASVVGSNPKIAGMRGGESVPQPTNIVITSIEGGNRITFTSVPDTQTEIYASVDGGEYAFLVRLNIGVETYDHTGLYANVVDYKLRSYNNVLSTPVLSAELIAGGVRLSVTGVDTDGAFVKYYANIEGAGYLLIATVAVSGATSTYDHLPTWLVETNVVYKVVVIETEFTSSDSNETPLTSPATISEGEAIIIAGNTVGWYDPTDADLVRDVGAGETDIWWDKIYGKEGELGSILESGSSVIYTVYQITATAANYFYTGCQVGDVWACSAIKALSATNSLKKFTGNHLSGYLAGTKPINHIFDGSDDYLKTPAFTLVRPEFIYFVGKQVTWTLNDTILDGGGSTSAKLQQNTATPKIRLNNGVTSADNANFPVDTLCILRLSLTIGGGSVQVNNTAATGGPTGTNEMNGFTIGCQGGLGVYANIDVREIIVRNKTDDATDQTKIYNYLATKHGLPTI